MQTFALTCPGLLDPAWFNRVRHGQRPAVVAPDGAVDLDGVSLRPHGEGPAVGTAVQVWLNAAGHFVCATVAELERQAQAARDAAAARAEERRRILDALRTDAETFNARIAIPARWDVGIKDVLSGLSERSNGDGRSKATVHHIYLLEPLQAGRLTRRIGDFLCTAPGGSNGKRWSSKVVERSYDGRGQLYRPKVNCKACLSLTRQWTRVNDGSVDQ